MPFQSEGEAWAPGAASMSISARMCFMVWAASLCRSHLLLSSGIVSPENGFLTCLASKVDITEAAPQAKNRSHTGNVLLTVPAILWSIGA